MSEWRTEWTGSYPNLCSGVWHLYKDDVEVYNPFKDEDGYGVPADTYGMYSGWYFDGNYMEMFYDYEDGLSEKAWIDEHKEWLSNIADEEEWFDIYYAFQANDWRYGSCGGCI